MSDDAAVIAQTRAWVERAVIGLNLCPFAKAVQVKQLIRYVVCNAETTEGLLAALRDELQRLAATPADEVETTLLVHPKVLADFFDFNHFLVRAERELERLGQQGVLQLASFHPQYQFAGSDADDIANATNRSPWPTLHLIREASIDRAVAAFPEAATIYETNIATLQRLGPQGWAALQRQCLATAAGAAETATSQAAGPLPDR